MNKRTKSKRIHRKRATSKRTRRETKTTTLRIYRGFSDDTLAITQY